MSVSRAVIFPPMQRLKNLGSLILETLDVLGALGEVDIETEDDLIEYHELIEVTGLEFKKGAKEGLLHRGQSKKDVLQLVFPVRLDKLKKIPCGSGEEVYYIPTSDLHFIGKPRLKTLLEQTTVVVISSLAYPFEQTMDLAQLSEFLDKNKRLKSRKPEEGSTPHLHLQH